MINIEKLSHKPKVFRSLTGMDYIKFNILLEKIEPLWQKAELNRKKPDKERLRRFGGGRTPKIGLDQNLFCLLVYYRTYVSHEFIGMLASIDGTNIGRRFSGLQPILAQFFRIPERKINLTEEEILELIVDATEQETQRRDGSGYSGKKKKNPSKPKSTSPLTEKSNQFPNLTQATSMTRKYMTKQKPLQFITGENQKK